MIFEEGYVIRIQRHLKSNKTFVYIRFSPYLCTVAWVDPLFYSGREKTSVCNRGFFLQFSLLSLQALQWLGEVVTYLLFTIFRIQFQAVPAI